MSGALNSQAALLMHVEREDEGRRGLNFSDMTVFS
jgi:hypothetical protein